jgi:phospholipid-binding lipoprotein MlaA
MANETLLSDYGFACLMGGLCDLNPEQSKLSCCPYFLAGNADSVETICQGDLKVRNEDVQMILRRSETVINRNDLKPLALAIVILALMTVGCAVSERTASSTFDSPDSNEPGVQRVDEEFDLLDEELAQQVVKVADPLEPWNRLMYHINDGLYFWVVKPVSEVYTNVAPQPVRLGINNFFQNLTTPVRFVNCLLQGKGDSAGTEFDRFVINTTAGVLGFGDPARDEHGLQPVDEDLGQTLAVAGFDNGFYIVWPLLGPSTARDSVGKVGDMFLNPVFYVEHTETAVGIYAVRYTNESSFHIGEYEALKSESLDFYVAMRDMYIQYRNKKIRE